MKKEKVHIDSAFIDHSWGEMSKLLAKEMPVKKKKRRFLWLWLIGIGILTCATWTYLHSNKNLDVTNFPIPQNSTPIATTKNTKVIDNQPLKENIKENSLPSISKNKQSSDTTNLINSTKRLTFASPSETNTSAPSVSEAGIFQKPIIAVSDITPSLSNKNPKTNSKIIEENKTLFQQVNSPKSRKFLENFDPIPSLNFPLLSIAETKEIIPIIIPLNLKSKWHFGIYAAKLLPKFGSFSAGLHANVRFNPKWSLYFGLGYSRRVAKIRSTSNKNNDAENAGSGIELAASPDSTDVMDTGIGMPPPTNGPTTDNTGVANTDLPVYDNSNDIAYQNFHYFDLPILVQYQINTRLSVELGGQISRIYGYRYDLADNSYFSRNELSAFHTNNRNNLSDTASTIKDWEVAALGGFAYKISPNFQAYSNFHYGLNTYLTPPDFSDEKSKKWRQIQVGIRYYFK